MPKCLIYFFIRICKYAVSRRKSTKKIWSVAQKAVLLHRILRKQVQFSHILFLQTV